MALSKEAPQFDESVFNAYQVYQCALINKLVYGEATVRRDGVYVEVGRSVDDKRVKTFTNVNWDVVRQLVSDRHIRGK